MTRPDEPSWRQRTAATMRDTADQLEVAAGTLHDLGDDAPDPATAARLHALGDEVTTQARTIGVRAGLLLPPDAVDPGPTLASPGAVAPP